MSKLKRKVKKLFKSKVFTTLFSLSLFLLAGGTALLLTTIPVQAASNYGLEVSFWFDQPADTSYSDLDKSFVVGGINNESESLYTGGLVNLADINKYLRDPTSGGFLNDNTDWVDVLITQPAADKAKQGYSFAGYYGGLGTAENGELFYDAEGSYKGPGYLSGDISYDNWYEYYGGGGSHDLYLVAKWTPHITFNNGFTDDVMSGKVDFLSG
ncbi:MAG: hypothetical protein IJZ62_03940, partial [Clostridia bacterium]|nr:hypothetical protein [Clostridia bacterium]